MTTFMRIMRYHKGTSNRGILYKKNEHADLLAYIDSDWAEDRVDRKSTSAYFTLVGGNLVTWKSKKQKVVASSSAEVEFKGIAKKITEITWLKKLLRKSKPRQHSQVSGLQADSNPNHSLTELNFRGDNWQFQIG
ncbi:uncharacterized mitochondrial protein AtMg00810-like [Amaranthus tricolor]|uniref:uncharacterized mitochondrial protein AtMg00810-like n=1 Tax=Amaranthus tricolor TaxID=29722 RepID=UPI00258932F8|nr:uncharacterized mitochondrial protein AtMg00810-like [Amaranthus tricolor]